MARFSLRSDIAFADDNTTRFMPRIIALVMVLVTFMVLCALSLGDTLSHTAAVQTEKILVHIPAAKDQKETTEKVMAALKNSGLVKNIKAIEGKALQSQLKPWLGTIADFEDLPMPQVIRMSWRDDTTQDIARLETMLQAIDRDIRADTRHQWAENYAHFIGMLQLVLIMLSLGLLAAAAVLLMFAATTSLNLHQRTVTLLHHIGAHDDYIAGQFQRYAAHMAFRGALLGSLIALALYVLLGFYIRSLHAALLPTLPVMWWHIALVLALPLAAAGIGFVTARYTTLHYLQRLV